MNEIRVVGVVMLEDILANVIVGPEPGEVRCRTDGRGRWLVEFMTPHRLTRSRESTGPAWLRVDDARGRPVLRLPLGVVDEVVLGVESS